MSDYDDLMGALRDFWNDADRRQAEGPHWPKHCLEPGDDGTFCDGPEGHDGGHRFTPALDLIRRLEFDLWTTSAFAGEQTNELRELRHGSRSET